MNITGLHHVTAIASDPQRNLDFYVELLGLRLVKRTVNFDDPGHYHFYFGDEVGSAGTILTFFPWGEGIQQGRKGSGMATEIGYSVPKGSLDFWQKRFEIVLLAVIPVVGAFIATSYDNRLLLPIPFWVILICHAAIGLGTMAGGWRIVRTMGMRITRLKPVGGFCAETGAAAENAARDRVRGTRARSQ